MLKNLINITNQKILLPFYHLVTDDENTFAKYLYKPRKVDVFRKDLEILLKYYKPVTLQELIKINQQKRKINTPIFHLTFDDGLANFYEVVAPILEEKKVPATVFLNTDFVDNQSLFYRYKASLLFQFYENSSETIQQKFDLFFGKTNAVKENLLAIKFKNRNLLDDLAKAVNYSFDEHLSEKKPYLTTVQINDLLKRGFTIGAHSKNHPLYADLVLKEQLQQTKQSLDFVQNTFNIDYKAFSFPFTDLGVTKAFFKKMEREIDISFGISALKNDDINFNFHRISLEVDDENVEHFLVKLYLRYLVKIPFRKHKMPRK